MKVTFGISVSPGTPLLRAEDTQKFMDLVKMADGYGAAAIGTFDTAFIGGDAYVRATLIALAAARARRVAPDEPAHPRTPNHGGVPRLHRQPDQRPRVHGPRER